MVTSGYLTDIPHYMQTSRRIVFNYIDPRAAPSELDNFVGWRKRRRSASRPQAEFFPKIVELFVFR